MEQIQEFGLPPKTKRRDLSDEEASALRRLVGKLAWPARHVLPSLAYGATGLAQQGEESTTDAILAANETTREAQRVEASPCGVLRNGIRDLPRPMAVAPVDASLANEDGRKSQTGAINLLNDEKGAE